MRIIINVKARMGNVELVPRLDRSSADDLNVTRAGEALYADINRRLSGMERRAGRSKAVTVIRVGFWLVVVIGLVYAAVHFGNGCAQVHG